MEAVIYVSLFVGVTILVAMEPGPGFVKLSAETGRKGARFARAAAVGMALGALPHIAAVASGLHALVEALPGALTMLKIVGFCYIAWQICSLLRGEVGDKREAQQLAADAAQEADVRHRMRDSVASGFLLVLTNPRTPAFYAAYLPLFVRSDSAVSTGSQLLITGASAAVILLAVDMVFIALAGRTANRLAGNPLINRLVKYLGASLLGLFGLRLLLSRE